MACECQVCPECGGSGDIWISFDGEYMGRFRCDDLDELDVCPYCDGLGVWYQCDECAAEEYEDAFETEDSP